MQSVRFITGAALALTLTGPAGAAVVRGTLLYEKIPATLQGLDFARSVNAPAGKVRVELRTADQRRVLARGTTDEAGQYRFSISNSVRSVVLVAFAQSDRIQVGDPTTRSLHGMASAPFDPLVPPRQVVIPDQGRLSGPFNILATIRQANARLAQVDPGFSPESVALTVYWSPTSRNTYFHPQENALYLKGQRDVNSDEFDDAVILHEYGHYLARNFSRDDSFPGPHSPGDRLDPRHAWSEGWATFFALAILNTPVYLDTLGPGGRQVFAWDMEEDAPEWDQPGYWSEHSVGSALWDVCAGSDLSGDHVGLGLQPVWRSFREHLPTQVFVYLLTMIDGLIAADPARDGAISGVLAKRQIAYRHGVVPPVEVPFPRLIGPGDPVRGSVDSSLSRRINLLEAADYFRFSIATDRYVEIRLTVTAPNVYGAADLMLVLYDGQGRFLTLLDQQHGVGSSERIARQLAAGTYIIGVWSYRWTGSGYLFDGGDYELIATF